MTLTATIAALQQDAANYRRLADEIGALASDGWDDDAAEVAILIDFVRHLAAFHPDCPGRFCDEENAETPEQSAEIVDANLRSMDSRGLNALDANQPGGDFPCCAANAAAEALAAEDHLR